MKKVLLGTSAIALASAYATSASAAEWEVKVGGYMEQHIGYASVDDSSPSRATDGDFDGVDIVGDSEIHFKPSITLDNGLKIGADIQLEGNTSGDTIDESFMFIRGSFGEVLLGSENSAGYKMTYAAPDVTAVNLNSGSQASFVPYSGTTNGAERGGDLFRATLGATFLENAANNDAVRMTYFTPRFAGFQLGVSYARDAGQDSDAQINCAGTNCNFFDVGANYVNSFGGFDVAVSGRWGIADTGTGPTGGNAQVHAYGINLGFAGFTVGGSWGEQNNAGALDGTVFDAGVSYETGPWGFSFTYFNGENVDNQVGVTVTSVTTGGGTVTSTPNAGQLGNDENVQGFLAGVRYKLAKGVGLTAFGGYVEFEEDTGDAGGAGDDIDGFFVGTGIKINF